jgi:hypothetical protein
MNDLAEFLLFLLARISEDEAMASNWSRFELRRGIPGSYAIKDRVLAESRAKRQIVGLHGIDRDGYCACCVYDSGGLDVRPCLTLRALAAVYADHSDYREEWRDHEWQR